MTWTDATRADTVSWEVGRAGPSRRTVSEGPRAVTPPRALGHLTVSGAQRWKTRAWPLLSYQTRPCHQSPLPWLTVTGLDWGPGGGRLWEQRKTGAIGLRWGSRTSTTDQGQGLSRCSAVKRGWVVWDAEAPSCPRRLPPTPMSGWPGEAQEPSIESLHSNMPWRCSRNPPEECGG